MEKKDWHKFTSIKPKQCTLEDFCPGGNVTDCDEHLQNNFAAWTGFSTICPDLSDADFEIMGTPGSMISHKLVF